MKFFVDTAEISEIRELAATGLLDGVTTNPSLIAKSGRNMREVIAEICSIVSGPVSAEVAATEYKQMLMEAATLLHIAPNVAIKVPLTPDGLRACHVLSKEGVMVNVTLCFSAAQALLAAKAGAAFISPFVGRLDDIGQNGMELIADMIEAAKIGADVATIPPSVIRQLYAHPLTDRGLAAFLADWGKTGQSIV
jgi:transaldolase